MNLRILTCVLPVAFIIPLVVRGADDDAAKERKRFEGTWEGYVVEGKGERPDRGPVKLKLVISEEGIAATQEKEGDLGVGSFEFDLSASPHTIDATRTAAPGKGQKYLGIYELTDDTLTWCTGNPRKDRPAEFITKAGGGQFLMILKRKSK
jgi:uncharacterized protein (TIGR03067 family)